MKKIISKTPDTVDFRNEKISRLYKVEEIKNLMKILKNNYQL